MLNIKIEGKSQDYAIHAENDRGELYEVKVEQGWGELEFYLHGELYETIAIEGKSLERVMTEYVLADLT